MNTKQGDRPNELELREVAGRGEVCGVRCKRARGGGEREVGQRRVVVKIVMTSRG